MNKNFQQHPVVHVSDTHTFMNKEVKKHSNIHGKITHPWKETKMAPSIWMSRQERIEVPKVVRELLFEGFGNALLLHRKEKG